MKVTQTYEGKPVKHVSIELGHNESFVVIVGGVEYWISDGGDGLDSGAFMVSHEHLKIGAESIIDVESDDLCDPIVHPDCDIVAIGTRSPE